ncbi:hypothetical protein [Anaerostipes caccae]|uniref:hypothetical protein n=1 Tax=Anaerostipes caccae TaxID=105841 RepID=UPI0038D3EA7C
MAKAKEDYCTSESNSFNKLVGGEMEKSLLIGIDDKFDKILKCCELYLNNDDEFIDMREKLSIIPTFLFSGMLWLCLRELKRYSIKGSGGWQNKIIFGIG